MSRKIILLNLALLLLAGTLVAQARKHYLDLKAHERDVLQQSVKPTPALPPPAVAPPAPVASVQYNDVAQRTLFSRDRNPNVIVEAPAPKPEPPMPALPAYYGQLTIGDPVIFLSVRGGPQKRFRAGEKVGDFDLVSFDKDTIKLAWNDKQVEKKLDEIKPKGDQPQQDNSSSQSGGAAKPNWMGKPLGTYQAPAPAPAAGQNTGGPQIKSVGTDAKEDDVKPDSPVGRTISGTEFRSCSLSDPTPEGKVVDGYKKVVATTLMGKSCYWEKVK